MPPSAILPRVMRWYFAGMQSVTAMDKSRSKPLRTFVYRTLAMRLGAVTLALTLVVLAFTYVQQRDIFERQLADVLETELALLMNRASGIASERGLNLVDAVVLAVEERRRVPADHVFGRFVYVRLSKPGIPRSLIAGDDDYALIGAARQALGDAPPDPPVQKTSSELIELAGVPHVRMLAPI